MSYISSQLPKSFHVQLARIMDEIQTAIQETTGKVPIGLLVSKPRDFGNLVGILRLCTNKSPTSSAFIGVKCNCSHALEKCEGVTHEGFDSLSFSHKSDYCNLTILPEYFEKGEIFLETHPCFRSREKHPLFNQQNILLPYHDLANLLAQLGGLVLLQGYVSYGFLVADAGEDENVRRLWSLIFSVENENYNKTGSAECIYLDVDQHPVSFTPVYMVEEPDPIPLVLKGEWETAVVYAEDDELQIV